MCRIFKHGVWNFSLYLTSEKAPIAETITVSTTVVTAVTTLFRMYRVKGTSELLRAVSKLEKLVKVGFRTRNLGGYINNSSIGLKAVDTMYMRGSAVNATSPIINE